jgi:hypothetical protein
MWAPTGPNMAQTPAPHTTTLAVRYPYSQTPDAVEVLTVTGDIRYVADMKHDLARGVNIGERDAFGCYDIANFAVLA